MQYLLEHISCKGSQNRACVGCGQTMHGGIAVCITNGGSTLDCNPTVTLLQFEFRVLFPLVNGQLLSAANKLHSDLTCDRAPS